MLTSVGPDQAVKTLCETWHQDDIPSVFTACGREALCAQPDLAIPPTQSTPSSSHGFATLFATRNPQLPSPVSPTSGQTPSPTGDKDESYSQAPEGSEGSNLVPIKAFVHEVLRRSRTSTGVLQTALCYLEAVRSKVPELLRAEKACPTSDCTWRQAPEPRIVTGMFEQDVSSSTALESDKTAGLTSQTIRIDDTVLVGNLDADMQLPTPAPSTCDKAATSLPPLPPLPSPLCCPRRTFLACLILASKFMQDRSYSNRAWAKLAGLPPREIGRCERALGEALEWRLWVGKLPSSTSSGRPVLRSRSEGDIVCASPRTYAPSTTASWAAPTTAGATAPASLSYVRPVLPPPVQAPSLRTRCLQRSATVPAMGSDRSGMYGEPAASTVQLDGLRYGLDVRAAPGMGFDMAYAMDVEPQVEVSPSLSTPTLCDSPMSSSSSSSDGSEERTVQMSMYLDLPTPSPSSYAACNNSGGPWVANTSTYVSADPANPLGSLGPVAYNPYYAPNTLDVDLDFATERAIATGPTLPAFNPTVIKSYSTSLPSFAEAFPDPCIGIDGTSMQ